MDLNGIHGQHHWKNVRSFGNFILKSENLDTPDNRLIIDLFALLHDVERKCNQDDPGHGRRAATLVMSLPLLKPLPDIIIERLACACRGHDDDVVADNDIIGACWDSDRLDLTRFEWDIDPNLLSTTAAKDIAQQLNSADDIYAERAKYGAGLEYYS